MGFDTIHAKYMHCETCCSYIVIIIGKFYYVIVNTVNCNNIRWW